MDSTLAPTVLAFAFFASGAGKASGAAHQPLAWKYALIAVEVAIGLALVTNSATLAAVLASAGVLFVGLMRSVRRLGKKAPGCGCFGRFTHAQEPALIATLRNLVLLSLVGFVGWTDDRPDARLPGASEVLAAVILVSALLLSSWLVSAGSRFRESTLQTYREVKVRQNAQRSSAS